MTVQFERDLEKDSENLKKHGVEFNEAATVFADPLSVTVPDPDHPKAKTVLLLSETAKEPAVMTTSFNL